MIILLRTLVIAAFFALPAPVLPATAVESDSSNYRLTSTVTQETLQANIREAEASTELDESTRKKLIELYRSALAYLEEAGAQKVQ